MRTLLAVAIVGLLACQSQPRRPDPKGDAFAIEKVLLDWYVAIHDFDSAAIAGPLTPTFLIYEDTTLLSKDELLEGILSARGQLTQTAELSGLKTRVNGDVAWTSLRNHEVFTPTGGGAKDSADFLETVVFERVGGRWMIDRYHAAKLDPAKR